MAGQKAKGSKKNRKHGHNRRKPAGQRYLSEMRWEKNKKAKMQRHRNRMAKKAKKLQKRQMATTD